MAFDLLRSAKHIRNLSDGEFRVLFYLLDTANNETFECYPRISTIAESCEMTERTVQRHITALAKRGLFAREEQRRPDGSRSANLYRFKASGYIQIGNEVAIQLGPRVEPEEPGLFDSPQPDNFDGLDNRTKLSPPPDKIVTTPRQNCRDINQESEPVIRTKTPYGVGDFAENGSNVPALMHNPDDDPAALYAFIKDEWAKVREEVGPTISGLRGLQPKQEREILKLTDTFKQPGETRRAVWELVFREVRGSRFLQGLVPPRPGSTKSFKLSITTLLQARIFQEVVNGKYTDDARTKNLIDPRTGGRLGPAAEAGNSVLQRIRNARER